MVRVTSSLSPVWAARQGILSLSIQMHQESRQACHCANGSADDGGFFSHWIRSNLGVRDDVGTVAVAGQFDIQVEVVGPNHPSRAYDKVSVVFPMSSVG